jgi:hypothetical protein
MLQDGFNQSQTRVSNKKNDHGLDFTIDKKRCGEVSQGSMGSKFFSGTYQSEGYSASRLGAKSFEF